MSVEEETVLYSDDDRMPEEGHPTRAQEGIASTDEEKEETESEGEREEEEEDDDGDQEENISFV